MNPNNIIPPELAERLRELSNRQMQELTKAMMQPVDQIMNAMPKYATFGACGMLRTMNRNLDSIIPKPSEWDNGLRAEYIIIDESKRDEEAEKLKLSKLLDHDALFRFAYVPFVIAELVWDYADTIIDLSITMRIAETKKLCRAIRELRRDYDRLRSTYIDQQHRDSETQNMYMFEDGVSDIFKTLLVNLRCDLTHEYPQLLPDSLNYLLAVYQCDILLKSLLLYVRRQTEKVENMVGHRIGRILPKEIYRLDKLILEFVGDNPVSDRFASLKETYIKTFATQIALIELNEI